MVNAGRRWWAVSALAVSGIVIGIDATVLSLALPNLATDLPASTSDLQWFLDAYLLALGAMMLPAGMLGDRFGRKRLLLGSLALFGVGSIACAYSTSSAELIAARTLLGLAAAFVLPLSISVLPVLFPADQRQRALALVVGSALLAYPIGPILGGFLLNHFWWGAVFLINVPVIAIAVLLVGLAMPESRSDRRRRLDVSGVLLSTVGLVALTYGVIEAGERGWGDARALAAIAAGLLLLAGFIGWELRLTSASDQDASDQGASDRDAAGNRQPVVDLRLFGSGAYSWGTILSTLMQFALIGLLFAVPQYFRAVLGTDAMGAGLRLLPLIGGMVVGLAAGDPISRKAGSNITVGFGFLVLTAAMFTAATTGTGSGTGFALAWLALGGLGTGIVLPPAMNAALSQLTPERSGVGSAVITAIRQVGGVFGVAVLGSVLSSAYRGRLDLGGLPAPVATAARDGVSSGAAAAHQAGSAQLLNMVRMAYVHGMDVMLAVAAGIAAVSAVLALVFLPRRLRRPVPASPVPPKEAVESKA